MAKKTKKSPAFASLLRKLCEARWPGETIQQWAAHLGVSGPTLSRFLNISMSPAPETVHQIAEALGADPAMLFAALDGYEVSHEAALFESKWWNVVNPSSPSFRLYVAYTLTAPPLRHPFATLILLAFQGETAAVSLTELGYSLEPPFLFDQKELQLRREVARDFAEYMKLFVNIVNFDISENVKKERVSKVILETLCDAPFSIRPILHAYMFESDPQKYIEAIPPHLYIPFFFPNQRHNLKICFATEVKRIEKRLLPFATEELKRLEMAAVAEGIDLDKFIENIKNQLKRRR